eukprot:497849-Rhodomonas_salina.1
MQGSGTRYMPGSGTPGSGTRDMQGSGIRALPGAGMTRNMPGSGTRVMLGVGTTRNMLGAGMMPGSGMRGMQGAGNFGAGAALGSGMRVQGRGFGSGVGFVAGGAGSCFTGCLSPEGGECFTHPLLSIGNKSLSWLSADSYKPFNSPEGMLARGQMHRVADRAATQRPLATDKRRLLHIRYDQAATVVDSRAQVSTPTLIKQQQSLTLKPRLCTRASIKQQQSSTVTCGPGRQLHHQSRSPSVDDKPFDLSRSTVLELLLQLFSPILPAQCPSHLQAFFGSPLLDLGGAFRHWDFTLGELS